MLATAGAAAAFMGCSSSDDSSGLGTSTAGATNHGGSGGSSSAHGGSSGSVGVSGGGATGTAGTSATAGAGGAAAGTGGATAGAGGAAAGAGGASGGSGGAGAGGAGAGGAGAGAGGATAGAGGATGGSAGAGVDCADENTGVGTGTNVTTAVVLIDDVVIDDAASTLATSWQFTDGTTITDTNSMPRPADKWSRTSYGNADITGASDTFLSCAGNPAAGSLKNVIPFSDDNQYYQVSVLFAAHNYKGYKVSANVKLVGGGRTTHATCQAGAFLYAIGYVPASGATAAQYPNSHKDTDPFTPLVAGKWTPITLTIPSDAGFDMVQELAVQVSTYSCGTGN